MDNRKATTNCCGNISTSQTRCKLHMSLKDIALEMGITIEGVRKIEERALRKLAKKDQLGVLREYLEHSQDREFQG